MTATNRSAAHIYSTPYAIACAAILALALLAGCARVNTAQTTAPGAESRVCNNDTDTFCIENDQQKAAKLNQHGLEFAAKQDYDQALGLFKQTTALDSANPEYYYNLGLAYSYKGLDAEAEAAYLAALAIKPNASDKRNLNTALANAHYNLACLYALQGKKDQAFEHLDKLAAMDNARDMYHSMKNDKDLESLKDDPRFKPVVDKIANGNKSPEPAPPPAQ